MCAVLMRENAGVRDILGGRQRGVGGGNLLQSDTGTGTTVVPSVAIISVVESGNSDAQQGPAQLWHRTGSREVSPSDPL